MIFTNKRTVKKQEKRMSKMVGGHRQPLSGADTRFKGDGISEDFLCEAKQTQNQSMTLKLSWIEKIDTEATEANKYPLLDVEFLNAKPTVPKEWVSVPKYVFEMLYEAWKESQKKEG